jgi:hypothetical protein
VYAVSSSNTKTSHRPQPQRRSALPGARPPRPHRGRARRVRRSTGMGRDRSRELSPARAHGVTARTRGAAARGDTRARSSSWLLTRSRRLEYAALRCYPTSTPSTATPPAGAAASAPAATRIISATSPATTSGATWLGSAALAPAAATGPYMARLMSMRTGSAGMERGYDGA